MLSFWLSLPLDLSQVHWPGRRYRGAECYPLPPGLLKFSRLPSLLRECSRLCSLTRPTPRLGLPSIVLSKLSLPPHKPTYIPSLHNITCPGNVCTSITLSLCVYRPESLLFATTNLTKYTFCAERKSIRLTLCSGMSFREFH